MALSPALGVIFTMAKSTLITAECRFFRVTPEFGLTEMTRRWESFFELTISWRLLPEI